MDEACSTCGERRGANNALVGRDKGKTTLGTTRRRWNNNIKMNLQAV
jgi:hypothetical protein